MVKKPILLAFSGGIDSCAAVSILQDMGYYVELLTIDMMGEQSLIDEARRGAQKLGVKLHIFDAREIFEREIINEFISEYMTGRTPAPCTRCNSIIKWEILATKADELGIFHIATGHYFRINEIGGRHFVSRAKDPKKDQSYYLWGVREDILARAVAPMGEMIKCDVMMASTEVKRESMGICFLKGMHYSEFICSRCGELSAGNIVDSNGIIVGRHNGVARYTIGQKRGVGIPAGLRVIDIFADQNVIVVDQNEKLYTTELHIKNCHFIDIGRVENSSKIEVMIRGLGINPMGYAKVTIIDEHNAVITLIDDRAWAAAIGQPIALYEGSDVVGGGYLELRL